MSTLVKIILIGILVVAIPVSVKLVQEQQILKSKAAGICEDQFGTHEDNSIWDGDCVDTLGHRGRYQCIDGVIRSTVTDDDACRGSADGGSPNNCDGHAEGSDWWGPCDRGTQIAYRCTNGQEDPLNSRACGGTTGGGGPSAPVADTPVSNGPAGCLADYSAGESWAECQGCNEGVTTCNADGNYSFDSVKNPSPNCGSTCGGQETPPQQGTPGNVGVNPNPPAGGTTPGGTQSSACKIPMASFTGNSSCTAVPNNSYRWVIVQPGTGGAPAIDATRFGANNACGGANAAAAHAVCPQNTSDSLNVRASTSNWCYEFTEGNRCIQLRHEGTGGGPGQDTGTCNIDDQSPDLGPTCAACLSSKTSPTNVPAVISNIKGMNPTNFNGCSNQKILNKWCNGFGATAAQQCNELKSGVCATSCGGSLPNPVPPPLDPKGSFDSASCDAITGWTCDGDSFSTPLRVDFYANGPAGQGVGIGSVTAGAARESAVGTQCGGNNNHGFSFAVPANSLRDGQPHNIYAYGINTGSGTHTLLPGSPKSITCASAPVPSPSPVVLTAPACNTPASGSTVNPNNVSFNWGAVTGATSYEFRLWDYRAGGWDDAHWIKESVGKTGLTTTSYDGTQGQTFIYNGVMTNDDYRSPINLTAGRNYRYRVAARNSAGIGPWADCNFATTASTPRIEFRVAETPDFAGAVWEVYTGAGMSRNYTFQDRTPGLKTVFVEFRDAAGNRQTGSAQIELVAPPSPSPVPSASVVPPPSHLPPSSPIPSASPTPTPPPVVTTHFRIAENPVDLNSAQWQRYTSAPMRYDNFEFSNSNRTPGVKTIFVQFKDSNERVTCDGNRSYCSVQVRVLGDLPANTFCSLGSEGSTAILNINGRNFGSAQGTAAAGTTSRQVRSWNDTNVVVAWPSAPIGQNLNVTLTTADGQSVDVSCSSLSQLALGARVFCRQPSLHQASNVNLTLAEATPGGRLVRENVSIDRDGVVQGITQRLEEGRQYNLSIKAPKALRKTTTFTAGPGTTNVDNFILWVGDIFPAEGGDGLINGADKVELNRQWVVFGDAQVRSGDFNQDGRVNSIDWACMSFSMRDANGRGDDPEAVPGFPPVASPRPTVSPSSSPTVSPSPSASPGT